MPSFKHHVNKSGIKVKKFGELIEQPDQLDKYFKKFFRDNFNPTKIKEIKKRMYNLGSPKGSGAQIGLYIKGKGTQQVTNVVKVYNYASKSIRKENHCYYLNRVINEIFINLVISYPYHFNTALSKTRFLSQIKPNVNFVSEIGNDNEGVYLMMNYLAVYDPIFEKRYHNLYDLIKNNHIPSLLHQKKYHPEDFPKILEEYEKFLLKEVIKPFIKVLRYYQNSVGFIHTDLKSDNVFVKETAPNDDYKLLNSNDILTNFKPMLADFDASRINLPGFSILPDRRIKNRILALAPQIAGIVDDVRYNCRVKFGSTKCQIFSLYDFDILALMISIFFLILEVTSDLIKTMPDLIEYWGKELDLDQDLFRIIEKICSKNKGNKFMHVNNSIRLMCLNKTIKKSQNKKIPHSKLRHSIKKIQKSQKTKKSKITIKRSKK